MSYIIKIKLYLYNKDNFVKQKLKKQYLYNQIHKVKQYWLCFNTLYIIL